PVGPVEHDRIDRQLATAVLVQRVGQFLLRLVALAALPEAVGPLGQQHRLAGQLAVAGDHAVGIVGGHDVVVDDLRGLGPDRQIVRLVGRQRIAALQRDVGRLDAIPLDAQVVLLPGLEVQRELVVPGVPVLAPAVDHQLAVDIQLRVLAVEERKRVPAIAPGLDLSFPEHVAASTRREVLALFRKCLESGDELVVDLFLAPRELDIAVDRIGRGQRAGLAVLVVQRHHLANLAQAAWIAVAGDRVVVPEDAVVAARGEVGDRIVDVVLEQLDVAALEVHPALLVQAGAVQSLVIVRLEALADAVVRPAVELGGLEAATAGHLRHQRLAGGIEEGDATVEQRDFRRNAGGDHAQLAVRFAGFELRRRAVALHPHQAPGTLEIAIRIGGDADDAVGYDLQAHVGGALGGGAHDEAVVAALPAVGGLRAA